MLPIGLDVAPVIKDIDRAGEQTEHDKGASCPPNGGGMADFGTEEQRWENETVLHPLPDAQQSYRRPDHLQPSTPLSSARKVVIGGPKRQCHDGCLRIDAGRTRQHAAIRHDDIVEAS